MPAAKTRHQIHSEARDLATLYWYRCGYAPETLYEMRKATAAAASSLKYNPNHDPANGRFTFGPGGGGSDAVASGKKDPGAVPVRRNDGSIVTAPGTGKPLLMPKDVSLSDNAKIGEGMHSLSSVISSDLPQKEIAMLDTYKLMDYQRLYDDRSFNKIYTDFGNYNHGVMSAAAGYTLNQALAAAGLHNFIVRNAEQTGVWDTDRSEQTFIPIGYIDYKLGHLSDK